MASDPPGAQAERTRLAWVRTAIGMIVWSVVALRITVEDLGLGAAFVTAACALVSGAVLVASRFRYRRAVTVLNAPTLDAPVVDAPVVDAPVVDAPEHLSDGRLPAMFGLIVIALSGLVVAYAIGS